MGIDALVQERFVDLVKVSGVHVCWVGAVQVHKHAKNPT